MRFKSGSYSKLWNYICSALLPYIFSSRFDNCHFTMTCKENLDPTLSFKTIGFERSCHVFVSLQGCWCPLPVVFVRPLSVGFDYGLQNYTRIIKQIAVKLQFIDSCTLVLGGSGPFHIIESPRSDSHVSAVEQWIRRQLHISRIRSSTPTIYRINFHHYSIKERFQRKGEGGGGEKSIRISQKRFQKLKF